MQITSETKVGDIIHLLTEIHLETECECPKIELFSDYSGVISWFLDERRVDFKDGWIDREELKKQIQNS